MAIILLRASCGSSSQSASKRFGVTSAQAKHLGPLSFDPELVKPPVRHGHEFLGRHWQQQRTRPGCRFAKCPGDASVSPQRFAHRDALSKHDGKAQFPNVARFGDTQARHLVMKFGDQLVIGAELAVVLVLATNFFETAQQVVGPFAPSV